MLSRHEAEQRRQQGVRKGFGGHAQHAARTAAGTADGNTSSAAAFRVVKGVRGYAESPFDVSTGLGSVFESCAAMLDGGAAKKKADADAARRGVEARPKTRAEREREQTMAGKLLAPSAGAGLGGQRRPREAPVTQMSQHCGIGSHRLSAQDVQQQTRHLQPAHSFADPEADATEAAEGKDGASAAPTVDAATAVVKMQRATEALHEAEEKRAAPQSEEAASAEASSGVLTEAERMNRKLKCQLIRGARKSRGDVGAADDGDVSDDDDDAAAKFGRSSATKVHRAEAPAPEAAGGASPKTQPAPVAAEPTEPAVAHATEPEEEEAADVTPAPPQQPRSPAHGSAKPSLSASSTVEDLRRRIKAMATGQPLNTARKAELKRLKGMLKSAEQNAKRGR